MKHFYKIMLSLCLTLIMACMIIPTVSAQETSTEETVVTSMSVEDDGTKAYDLVWKYKKQDGHYYKRRWNKTLNKWYDPAWILVQ